MATKTGTKDLSRFEKHDRDMLLAAYDLCRDLEERFGLRIVFRWDMSAHRGALHMDLRAYRNGAERDYKCIARYQADWPNGKAVTLSAFVFHGTIQLDRLVLDWVKAETAPEEPK